MTQCTQCLHGAKIQMIIVRVKMVSYSQDEEANKELSGSLEIQFSLAGVQHCCYNFYLY